MNNDTSDGGATVPCISLFDVTDLCQREGIELRGDDGQPYCCGERMDVRGGIIGPDFAKCRKCGKAIGNAASPHINGGRIPSDEWIKENGNKTWYVLHTSNPGVHPSPDASAGVGGATSCSRFK